MIPTQLVLAFARDVGISDPTISDRDVADRIIKKIGTEAYSTVVVKRKNCDFDRTILPGREITLAPTSAEWISRIFLALFKSPEVLNANRSVNYVLGSVDPSDKIHFKIAYDKNSIIKILIAEDVSTWDFDVYRDSKTDSAVGSCVIS